MSIEATDAAAPAQSSAPQSMVSLQDAAKWVVGAFAAIGAILVAGLQLGAVGSLGANEPLRLALALGVTTVALVAVGAVLTCAARVLVSPQFTLADLADRDLKELKRINDEKQKNPAKAFFGEPSDPVLRAISRKREELLKSDAGRPLELHRRLTVAQDLTGDQLKLLQEDAGRLTSFADLLTARARFTTLMRWLLAGGGLIAVCIVLFGWATNPPKEARVVQPIETQVVLTGSEKALGAAGLRPTCAKQKLNAVAVAGELRTPEVVTLGSPTCPAARFRVTRDVGLAIPVPATKGS